MKKNRHTTKQIIEKLRQADVALGKGQQAPEICKELEITPQTYLPLASEVRRYGARDGQTTQVA